MEDKKYYDLVRKIEKGLKKAYKPTKIKLSKDAWEIIFEYHFKLFGNVKLKYTNFRGLPIEIDKNVEEFEIV